MELFRREVLKKKREGALLGDVIVIRPLSFAVYSALLLSVVIALLLFLFFGTYANKESVAGSLVPTEGLSKVYPLTAGTIEISFVEEGTIVSKDDPLILVATGQFLSDQSDLQERVVAQIKKTMEKLRKQIAGANDQSTSQITSLRRRIPHVEQQLKILAREITTQGRNAELKNQDVRRAAILARVGHLSASDLAKVRQAYFDAQLQLQELERSRANQRSLLEGLKGDVEQTRFTRNNQIFEYERSISELEQRLAESSGARRHTILAPIAGRVSSIQGNAGDKIRPDQPLLTILPIESDLEVELLVPTRAIGFVRVGQEVRLRFDAFPYQRFGVHLGQIKSASKNVFLPQETSTPIEIKEPFYKVRVALNKQTVTAFGKEHALRPGMSLRGDIVRDRRALINWILEPLYSLKGRS